MYTDKNTTSALGAFDVLERVALVAGLRSARSGAYARSAKRRIAERGWSQRLTRTGGIQPSGARSGAVVVLERQSSIQLPRP